VESCTSSLPWPNCKIATPSSSILTRCGKKEWVIYAKPPFAGPAQVLDYVGRYTHRVAISNNRLLDMEDGHVRFRWKDYADATAEDHDADGR